MRKIINLAFLLIDFGITSLILSLFYFGIFYLVPNRTYSDQTINIIWFMFFLPFLIILFLLITYRKTRTIIFSKAITLIAGILFMIFFLFYYASEAINTYQAVFRMDSAKPHDYLSIPVFISMTLLMILAGIFTLIRKYKNKFRQKL